MKKTTVLLRRTNIKVFIQLFSAKLSNSSKGFISKTEPKLKSIMNEYKNIKNQLMDILHRYELEPKTCHCEKVDVVLLVVGFVMSSDTF